MAMGFADAIQTLRGMFAHIPEETLAVVLESHSGHMERTVEYLLAMGVDERPTSNVAPDAIGESDFTEALTVRLGSLVRARMHRFGLYSDCWTHARLLKRRCTATLRGRSVMSSWQECSKDNSYARTCSRTSSLTA